MKPLIVANWKMNPPNLAEAKRLFSSVKKGIKGIRNVEVVICPPFPYLSTLNNGDRISVKISIKLGGQDVFWEEKGAFTGEISPQMLKNLGCEYVIIGHSERRRRLGETDEMVSKKIKAALKIGLKPIICIGEKKRRSKENLKEMRLQFKKSLLGIKKSDLKNLIITYEPVWAISTTQGCVTATPKDAKEGATLIRRVLIRLLGKTLSQKVRILYGGSVDSKNVNSFIYEAQTDGVLVGAASLNPKEFVKLVKNVAAS